jgi:hypothetical protein
LQPILQPSGNLSIRTSQNFTVSLIQKFGVRLGTLMCVIFPQNNSVGRKLLQIIFSLYFQLPRAPTPNLFKNQSFWFVLHFLTKLNRVPGLFKIVGQEKKEVKRKLTNKNAKRNVKTLQRAK